MKMMYLEDLWLSSNENWIYVVSDAIHQAWHVKKAHDPFHLTKRSVD